MQLDQLYHACECPFCGGAHVFVARYPERIGTQWRATCGHCNAQTGFAGSPDAAIDAWNRRERQNELLDQGIDPTDDDIPVCPICGSEDVDWVDCPECGGKGGFDSDDLTDDDPLWSEGVEWEVCTACGGDGGWYNCYESVRHVEAQS